MTGDDNFELHSECNEKIAQLRSALDEACRIALGAGLNRESAERINELRAVGWD